MQSPRHVFGERISGGDSDTIKGIHDILRCKLRLERESKQCRVERDRVKDMQDGDEKQGASR